MATAGNIYINTQSSHTNTNMYTVTNGQVITYAPISTHTNLTYAPVEKPEFMKETIAETVEFALEYHYEKGAESCGCGSRAMYMDHITEVMTALVEEYYNLKHDIDKEDSETLF